jgi:hypothetical protein
LLAASSVVISITIFFGIAEVVLRFMPVATGLRSLAVTPEKPIFHFSPNGSFVFSRDWDMNLVNRGHINNDGWVNDQEYQRKSDVPLLAVVGDSFIEAAMVPYGLTLQGRLAMALEGRLRVYSFAASGAPLSQYLVWARYAVQNYNAQALVINVVGNDFDESHSSYKSSPGFWYYAPDDQGELRLKLFEYQPSVARYFVRQSALARYLAINLGPRIDIQNAGKLFSQILGGASRDASNYVGNTAVGTDSIRVRDSFAAVDAFFRDLPSFVGLPPERVLFVLDGFRYPDAALRNGQSYFDVMRRAFHRKAEVLGYEVLDLDPLFFARYRERKETFEYPNDAHWNPIGHAVAAEAVLSSKLIKEVLR